LADLHVSEQCHGVSGLLAMSIVGGVQQPTGDSAGNVGIDIAVVPQPVGGVYRAKKRGFGS
jgi:hypothetical protein